MRRQLVYRTLVLLAVILSFSAALPLADTAAKPGNGNSENAKACQKGRWATLAREEDPGTAFQSQDECVSYGANGGVLVPHEIPDPVVTVTMLSPGEGLNYCIPSVEATGFAPSTTYLLDVYLSNNGTVIQYVDDAEVTTDGDGALWFTSLTYSMSSLVLYQAVIGGVSSDWVAYLC